MQLWNLAFEKGEQYESYWVIADSLEEAQEIALDEMTIVNDGWELNSAYLQANNVLMKK